jgi:5'-3' exonuclease
MKDFRSRNKGGMAKSLLIPGLGVAQAALFISQFSAVQTLAKDKVRTQQQQKKKKQKEKQQRKRRLLLSSQDGTLHSNTTIEAAAASNVDFSAVPRGVVSSWLCCIHALVMLHALF